LHITFNGSVTLFCCVELLQLAELTTERNSLAERLIIVEKTSQLQQQELQRRLHNVEETVQLRERDLVHVQQQYQMLYQQFALLQQQSVPHTVRLYCLHLTWVNYYSQFICFAHLITSQNIILKHIAV